MASQLKRVVFALFLMFIGLIFLILKGVLMESTIKIPSLVNKLDKRRYLIV